MQAGFFTMKDAAQVLHYKDLAEAQTFLKGRVTEFVNAHPKTEKVNIIKAVTMIENSRSIEKLSIATSNFILAHTSENLKVIR